MRKLTVWLLLGAIVLYLFGCGAEASQPTAPQLKAVAAPEASAPTEAAPLEGSLFLKVSSINLSLVGDSEDIYLGMIPRELVSWESDDPSIISVENGVLTATGTGTTTIRASYYDRQVTCTAGCLAETQKELDALGFDVLCQPKRVPPYVDLSTSCTYFDNAALIGDSITYMLIQRESMGNYLGDILFMARGGTSLNGFVLHFKNIYFQGSEMYLEDAIAQSKVERIYVLIGSNDIGDEAQRAVFMKNWDIMLERIREKSPDVEIVIISNVPQYSGNYNAPDSFFTQYNSMIAAYNGKLRQFCAENGCMYLDLCYYIEDHCGRMAEKYNLDGYHFNDVGYDVWMTVMRYYAQYELEGGTLS